MSEITKIVECPSCGARIAAYDRYCPACGRRMRPEIASEDKATDPSAVAEAVLPSQDPSSPLETTRETTPSAALAQTSSVLADNEPSEATFDTPPSLAVPDAPPVATMTIESVRATVTAPSRLSGDGDAPLKNDGVRDSSDAISAPVRPFDERWRARRQAFRSPEARRCMVSLAVSLLMLLFAFLPSVRLEYDVGGGERVAAHFSAADAVTLTAETVASFFLSPYQVQNSPLAAQARELAAALPSHEGAPLTAAESRVYDAYWFVTLRLALRSGMALPVADLLGAAVASLIYIGLCIGCSLHSLIGLIAALRHTPKESTCLPRRFIWLASWPPVVYYTLCVLARFGRGGNVFRLFGENTVRMAFPFVLPLLIALAHLIYLAIPALCRLRRRRELGRRWREILLCAVSMLLLLCAFLPFVTVNVSLSSMYASADTSVHASSYAFSQMESYEGGYYHNASRDQLPDILISHVTAMSDARQTCEQTRLSESLVHHTVMTGNAYPFMLLYPAIYGVSLLYLLSALLLFSYAVRRLLAEDAPPRPAWRLVLLLLGAVGYAAMATTVALSSNAMFELLGLHACRATVALAALLPTVLSVSACLLRPKRATSRTELAYDDPDISCSPYVVGV